MEADDYNLKWNNFEAGISSGIIEIYKSSELFDVTLVCGSQQINAHRLVLSACSPVFREILARNTHHNPIVYLRGISPSNLQATINFMYQGEVCVAQETLNDFLSTADDLKVKGLSQCDSEKTGASKTKKRSLPSEQPPLSENSYKKPKNTVKPLAKPVLDSTAVTSVKKEIAAVEEESSSSQIIETQVADLPLDDLAHYSEYAYEEHFEGIDDHVPENIQEDSIILPQIKDFCGYRQLGPKAKGDRQPIVNFLNMNKLKVDNGYMCTICNRISSDNSNMNRHIEVKHADELEVYLAANPSSLMVSPTV